MTREQAIAAIREEVGRGGAVTSTAIQFYTDSRGAVSGSDFARACREGAEDFKQQAERGNRHA